MNNSAEENEDSNDSSTNRAIKYSDNLYYAMDIFKVGQCGSST